MKKTFLIAAAVAALPCAVSANFLVSANDSYLGQPCWDDNPDYRLVKCTGAAGYINGAYLMSCEDTYNATKHFETFLNNSVYSDVGLHCIFGGQGNDLYACTSEGLAHGACIDAVQTAWNDMYIQNWTSYSNGRVYADYYSFDGTYADASDNESKINCSKNKKYKCDKGYYTVSGYDTSLVCAECPGDGTSDAPGVSGGINRCYLPSGTSFCDDSGCGTYKGKCYY